MVDLLVIVNAHPATHAGAVTNHVSPDGHWWWDGQQWQATQQQPAAGDSRAAARVAAGLPASLHDLTDEHRHAYVGQGSTSSEAVAAELVDVPVLRDTA